MSDAVAAFGLPDGQHRIGDVTIEKKGLKAVVSGTETLAGR